MSKTAYAVPLPSRAAPLAGEGVVPRQGDPVTGAVRTVTGRDERVDFWRGICILGMVSWHLLSHPSYPRWLSFPVIQGFNFVAEGFVLLAGAMVGLKLTRSGDWFALSRSSLSRAGKLLLLHWAVVAGLAALFVANPLFGPPPEQDLPHLAWEVLTLRYQPYLGDILSLFVFLFASLPVWLLIRRYLGDGALLLSSAGIYLAAILVPTVSPLNSSGAFVFNSWQVYFVLGVVFGAHYERVMQSWARCWRQYLLVLVPVTALAIAHRVGIKVSPGYAAAVPGFLLDERHPLTLFRSLYILCQMLLIGLCTVRYWEVFGRWRVARWVVLLGRHSMVVFVASVFLDYLLKAPLTAAGLPLPVNLLLWGMELVVLSGISLWLSRRRGRRPRQMHDPAVPNLTRWSGAEAARL